MCSGRKLRNQNLMRTGAHQNQDEMTENETDGVTSYRDY